MRRPKPVGKFIDEKGIAHVVHRYATGRMGIARAERSIVHELSESVALIVGKRIRALRLERGWTLLDLLQRAGLSGTRNRMKEIEQAKSGGLKLGTLYAVANALGVEPHDLLPARSTVFDADQVELPQIIGKSKEIQKLELESL